MPKKEHMRIIDRARRFKVLTIVGTRPEGIKMAPVIRALEQREDIFEHIFVSTAQHREMLDQVFHAFDIKPQIDLELMQPGQKLAQFASAAISRLSDLFEELKPNAILVQGDTTTVMSASLAAFYNGIKVGHVEAGLRSFDRENPFPEEINRKIAGCVGDFHFAPTSRARENLLREGVPGSTVFVTGNTIVDALRSMPLEASFENPELNSLPFANSRVLLLTAHRRENHGAPLQEVCTAIKILISKFPDLRVVYPVHLNPNVNGPVYKLLADVERIHLVEPVSYGDLLRLMKLSFLVLTDSGGIQEEAPSFHKPVLILREVTERPEVLEAGAGKLVGTDTEKIVQATSRLLRDAQTYRQMSTAKNPFGDGRAAQRIVKFLERSLKRDRLNPK
jgi:UDP-N-acetylglucosamine 2-epimerase (non-hydrolysing)